MSAKKAIKPAAAKKSAVPKAVPSHPTWADMIKECIAVNTEDARIGVSRPQIKKYVESKYKLEIGAAQTTQLAKAISVGAERGVFFLPKGPSGRVKLAPKSKPADMSSKENKPASKAASNKPASNKPASKAKAVTTKAKAKTASTTKSAPPAKKAAAAKSKAAPAPKKVLAGKAKAAPAKKTTVASKRAPAKKAITGTTAASKAKVASKKAPAKKKAVAKKTSAKEKAAPPKPAPKVPRKSPTKRS